MTKKTRMAIALLALTGLLALSVLPVAMAAGDPTITCQTAGCDYTTFAPSQTQNINLVFAWSGLPSTDSYCVFTSSTIQTSCPGSGLTSTGGFTLSGTAEYSTFTLGSTSGSQVVTLTATAPSSPASTSFYVEACDTAGASACTVGFEASLSMTLVQTPQFGASIAVVAAFALVGLLLVRRQSLKAPSVKAI